MSKFYKGNNPNPKPYSDSPVDEPEVVQAIGADGDDVDARASENPLTAIGKRWTNHHTPPAGGGPIHQQIIARQNGLPAPDTDARTSGGHAIGGDLTLARELDEELANAAAAKKPPTGYVRG